MSTLETRRLHRSLVAGLLSVVAVLLAGPLIASAAPCKGSAARSNCEIQVTVSPTGGGGGGDGGGGGNHVVNPSATGAPMNGGEPCEVPGVNGGPPQPAACSGTDPATVVTPEQLARILLARVQLRPIKVGITPLAKGPNSMGLVGLPVWLWADDPTRTTWGPATITAGAMSLTARVSSVTWDMGDGTRVSCGKGTRWKRGMVKADGSAYPSPTCGHTYSKQGTYTITATTHWDVVWSGYGQTGSMDVQLTANYRYVVAELQAIRVR